jgi:hypothetical protein
LGIIIVNRLKLLHALRFNSEGRSFVGIAAFVIMITVKFNVIFTGSDRFIAVCTFVHSCGFRCVGAPGMTGILSAFHTHMKYRPFFCWRNFLGSAV